jgi:NAD(P)-dependent dehydrogenase (short-subunit alcohol dehydrogenase family)
VTGASAGLGAETARVLAAHGASVVGTARDLAKAERVADKARVSAAKTGHIEMIGLDLASLESVRAVADALNAVGKPFDVVIANAGICACPWGKTADGFELQFGTNHLGHFVFVNRIAALIKSGGRLVNLASSAHRNHDVDIDDPNFERQPYTEFVGYSRSKTANILFAVEFDRRHRSRGVRATAVQPGGTATELDRYLTIEAVRQVMPDMPDVKTAVSAMPKSIPQGAATTVWAGFVGSPDAVGGKYCEDCAVAEIVDDPASYTGVRSYALDPARAQALWAKSEALVGERF